ncbi:MAG: OB-fold nucleic acid binding domain-containing protein [Candidatus Bathyarchaeota archaeon]|nr:OB-fold nucleic acid binding domain-containing protein [Candidatus Bathyarchaeota archaeon]MDH5636158.1 OB-fold nucleic acid binding domain-containing protein [Candidatus Bathyarchaeota archaeon]MDH5702197.1 OB-fold nucleic acid binding domain-containing protein [Candidatus Bathyarchaeota archaeon]
MKVSRQRGRPRGKYHALADFRLLEYLALISMKHGIDSNDFFNSFVEAWERQQSTCKGLLIECRKRTRDYAIFLITNSYKVVAQFPIPKHILEETSPLKEFAYAKAPRRTIVEGAKVKHLQIRDLKSGMNQISLEAKVLEIPKPVSVVTRFGEFAKVTNVSIKDETGIIHLPLWNKQIDEVSEGDVIQVENARVVTFRGERQLRVGRGGQLSVIEKR